MSPHSFIILVGEYKSGTQQLLNKNYWGLILAFCKTYFLTRCCLHEIIKLADKEELFLPINGIRKNDKTVILVEGNKQRH